VRRARQIARSARKHHHRNPPDRDDPGGRPGIRQPEDAGGLCPRPTPVYCAPDAELHRTAYRQAPGKSSGATGSRLGAESDRHVTYRRSDVGVEELFYYYCYTLDAAGSPGFPAYRVFHLGELAEVGATQRIFQNPAAIAPRITSPDMGGGREA